jgi:hypothetical protein
MNNYYTYAYLPEDGTPSGKRKLHKDIIKVEKTSNK